MSTSQVVFMTDTDLKDQTTQKLRKEWNTLKALLQYSMKAYLQWRISLWIITNDEVWTDELESDYQKNVKDLINWNNITEWSDLVKKHWK
jgi:hypothetical protein